MQIYEVAIFIFRATLVAGSARSARTTSSCWTSSPVRIVETETGLTTTRLPALSFP